MTNREHQLYMADFIRSMRESAGLSQEDLSAELDLSRATIIRTEAGDGQLTKWLHQWLRYCEITHHDPVRTTLQLLFPELFVLPDSDAGRTTKIKRLDYYLHNIAPDIIVDQINYQYYGAHGSVPEAVTQLLTAYLHLPLYMRHSISQQIATFYRQSQRMEQDPCPEEIQPDLALLDAANLAGFEASMNGSTTYEIK